MNDRSAKIGVWAYLLFTLASFALALYLLLAEGGYRYNVSLVALPVWMVLIVPEQFTSSTEGTLYHILGDSLSAYVESYSFAPLAAALLRRYNGSRAISGIESAKSSADSPTPVSRPSSASRPHPAASRRVHFRRS